ncbi:MULTISPECIES: ATP-binding protein [unclassified Leptolyngbya]|uniref:sensor histidine kinase n=1 Tax=unclassified Leptolyngbya TaxID=2650499 RepID=UPI00168554D6|nr:MULTISPECIES: ATP-binding protein [unclassified Leptolyngbya]MBD1913729.1 sensor histidine kinase [Leptolyngbya sp. FACHB-8]MBD2155682.1 sensor histidine kinase [Leptolyngbya sp. FACHB-16]
MFQETRQRLALWYTMVTAVLLLLFASGFYIYVRSTLIERIDDTLSHVAEVVQRSLVIEPLDTMPDHPLQLNLEASFRNNADSVEDDHIDLEWFSATGELLWSTLSDPIAVPLHPNLNGETVHLSDNQLLRQVTEPIRAGGQLLGYLRVSHPWFEVTKPTRQLVRDLALGMVLVIGAVATVGWFLSGLAIAPIRDSYQRLKQFTADASHELRNPIAVIQTNVQVALSEPEPDVQFQQNQLRVIERLTRRLGRLVDDLLFLARQDSNGLARQDTVDLDELVQEVVEEQQAIAAEKSISLNLQIQPPLREDGNYWVMGDRDQLMRLLVNLISNGIQYTSAQGSITLTLQQTRSTPPHFQIRVSDTGVGIAEDALPYIFDRFYRVDPARRHAGGGGAGLGLAIARAIVENHHGQIDVESEPGSGTSFIVSLPGQRAEAALLAKPVATPVKPI